MIIPEPTKLKNGQYRIQLRLNGKSVCVTSSTAKECKRQAGLIKAEYLAGKRMISQENSITLSDALDSYINRRSNVLSPSTVHGYKTIKKTRFLDYTSQDIRSIDWQKAVNIEATKCSAKTLKNAWGLVFPALSESGLSVSVKLPTVPKKEKPWLNEEEIKRFLVAAKGKPGETGALLALSSLRKSEIYGLDWADIDLEKKVIHVHSAKVLGEDSKPVIRNQNKTQASTRDVPIFLDRLNTLLTEQKKDSGPVITNAIGTLYDQIQTICKSANLPLVGVHGLRHSFASLCYSLGISELGAMQIGGWSDFQTMRKIYTHLSENEKTKSADKLSAFFK